ncbi:MAG: peptidase M50 [Ruminococcaceae bacterium]|nr:peptidase M50 [Oscillospiraceae bacterium]
MRRRRELSLSVSPLTAPVWALFALLSSPVVLVALLAAAAPHELGHWAVLRCFGGRVSRLRITPFGAEMVIADTARISYGAELLTALAGPAANLLLALVLGAAGGGWPLLYVFAGAQLVLGVFNLLPVPPLDGGRLLWLAAAWLTEPFTADRIVAAVGVLTAAALTAGGVLLLREGSSPFLLLGAAGLLLSALREKGLVKRGAAR